MHLDDLYLNLNNLENTLDDSCFYFWYDPTQWSKGHTGLRGGKKKLWINILSLYYKIDFNEKDYRKIICFRIWKWEFS